MLKNQKILAHEKEPVTLRTVADRVGLAPCSVSAVLNNSPASLAIPQRTKNRILRAARQLNYRPNLSARSLRTKRTYTVALLATDFGNPWVGRALAGVEALLRANNYSLLVAAGNGTPSWFEDYSVRLLQCGVEGVISIDAAPPRSFSFPAIFLDLSAGNHAEPVTSLQLQRLEAVGRAAAQAIVVQIEEKTGFHTRIALAPEAGFMTSETMATIQRPNAPIAHFAD
jgi:hypothetical protein